MGSVSLSRLAFRSRPLTRLFQAFAFARQRAHLAELDAHLLEDIGITEEERQAELSRAFWDAPFNWKQ